ncbi:MAG: DUF3526 domain-containing protein [Acidimicrobiia bacterium]|nr:DUF3526 domain-containing protein [Acidimicrobiia bacterium]
MNPAAVLHRLALRIAGTDPERYAAFQAQAQRANEHWIDFWNPLVFRAVLLTPDDWARIPAAPSFVEPPPAWGAHARSLVSLAVLAVAAWGLTLLWLPRVSPAGERLTVRAARA